MSEKAGPESKLDGSLLREAEWQLVQFGGTLFGFAVLWFAIFLIALIVWARVESGGPISSGSDGFAVSLMIGEFCSGAILVVSRRRRESRGHVLHSLERPLEKDNVGVAISRLGDALAALELYLTSEMTWKGYQAYFLRRATEEGKIPSEEIPHTVSELLHTISLEVSDCMRAERHPWPSMQTILTSLEGALNSDMPMMSLRDTLTAALYKSSKWYRRFAVSPPPSRLARFVGFHKDTLAVLAAIAIFIATIVGVLT